MGAPGSDKVISRNIRRIPGRKETGKLAKMRDKDIYKSFMRFFFFFVRCEKWKEQVRDCAMCWAMGSFEEKVKFRTEDRRCSHRDTGS